MHYIQLHVSLQIPAYAYYYEIGDGSEVYHYYTLPSIFQDRICKMLKVILYQFEA